MSKNTASRFARILLATDGSPSAQQAAEVAATIAKAFDSEVTVLSAIPSISARVAPLEGEYYSKLINKADDNADKAAAVFKKAGVTVSQKEVPQGRASVVEAITDYAAQDKTSLVVLGTRGLGGFKRALLGSVSSGVAEHSPCAALVVRPGKTAGAGKAIRRVLVAVDGSPNAQRALETAVDLAKGTEGGAPHRPRGPRPHLVLVHGRAGLGGPQPKDRGRRGGGGEGSSSPRRSSSPRMREWPTPRTSW